MNLWERLKDCFKETEKKKVVFEDENVINVDVNGTYEYAIKKSVFCPDWRDDHVVNAILDAKVECRVADVLFSKRVKYHMTIAEGTSKLDAYNIFEKMSTEQRREVMMDKLKARLTYDIKEHLEEVKEKDIDNIFKDMGVESLNITVQIEKDKIAKK